MDGQARVGASVPDSIDVERLVQVGPAARSSAMDTRRRSVSLVRSEARELLNLVEPVPERLAVDRDERCRVLLRAVRGEVRAQGSSSALSRSAS